MHTFTFYAYIINAYTYINIHSYTLTRANTRKNMMLPLKKAHVSIGL